MKQEESRLGNMDFAKLSEKLMRMDDEAWARHANPLSVWSRFSLLPLFALAVWSREWIGWWALVPVALVLLWNWVNPRLFGPPRSLDSWASKGVMGERLYLDRQTVRVREEHVRTARVLSAASALGAFILVYCQCRQRLSAFCRDKVSAYCRLGFRPGCQSVQAAFSSSG